jgi:hypothetical protein
MTSVCGKPLANGICGRPQGHAGRCSVFPARDDWNEAP